MPKYIEVREKDIFPDNFFVQSYISFLIKENAFQIYTISIQGDILYDTDNYDGWIPITNDQVLSVKIPDYAADFNYDISETNSDDNNKFKDEAITIVTPQISIPEPEHFEQETFRNIKVQNNFDCSTNGNKILKYNFNIANDPTKQTLAYLIYLSGVTICPEEIENIKTEVQTMTPIQYISPHKNFRRAKNLGSVFNTDSMSISDSSTTVKEDDLTTSKNNDIYKTPVENMRNVYEVTENPESFDPNAAESKRFEDLGYIYGPPKTLDHPDNSNYVDLLSKTLLKYNIDANDQLQNYALSKRNKNINTAMLNLVNIPHRFNSMNHLPVDPLLAVFLSNYGYYLRGRREL